MFTQGLPATLKSHTPSKKSDKNLCKYLEILKSATGTKGQRLDLDAMHAHESGMTLTLLLARCVNVLPTGSFRYSYYTLVPGRF